MPEGTSGRRESQKDQCQASEASHQESEREIWKLQSILMVQLRQAEPVMLLSLQPQLVALPR